MANPKAQATVIPLDPAKTNDQLEREAAKIGHKADAGPYSLKGLKTFPGREGEGFDAQLARDGKTVAHVHDDGNGGMIFIDWMDRQHGESAHEKAFDAFIETERAKIPADKKNEYDMLEREIFDGEIFVSDLVNQATLDRRFKRACKTHTLFQIDEEIGTGQWKQLKGATPEARTWVEKKYAGHRIRIINDEYASK